MGNRAAQEFWDKLWIWEEYERFPGEAVDDPHLFVELAGQISPTTPQESDLFRRYDQCVGRVLDRLNNLLPKSGEEVDLVEFELWLKFGLDPAHRGHGGPLTTPIIDANSLFIFRLFAQHAVDFSNRHDLQEMASLWDEIGELASRIDSEHAGDARPTRFDPEGRLGATS